MAIGTGTAMLLGSGLSAAGSLAGGLFGGGNNSGAAQSAANQAYLAAQHQAEVNKSDASPWTSAGREALNELGGLIGWGNLSNPGTNGSLWTYGGDPTGQFCNWTAVGVSFAGTAYSIDFGGTANQTAFDNITFGSDTPGGGAVPEPATWAMMILGFGLVGAAARRRKSALVSA